MDSVVHFAVFIHDDVVFSHTKFPGQTNEMQGPEAYSIAATKDNGYLSVSARQSLHSESQQWLLIEVLAANVFPSC